jgi:hypothetical protein
MPACPSRSTLASGAVGVLDIDLGPRLVFFLLVFIALPLVLAALVGVAIVHLVRNPTRRLAVGIYVMLVCAAVAPAPILWGDDQLGLTSSQALEGYGALFWAVGALVTMYSLSEVLQWRQLLVSGFGLIIVAVVLSGFVQRSLGAAVGLSLIPAVGTVEVLLAFGWLAHRGAGAASALDWRQSAAAAAAAAFAIAAYVYVRGPQSLGLQASGVDFALLAVVVWLPVVVLARLRTLAARAPAP